MLENKVPLAFGSDYPNDDFNPFHGWVAGFTRADGAGQPFGGWQPQQRITREQAWRAYTMGGAYAAFAEARIGRLADRKSAVSGKRVAVSVYLGGRRRIKKKNKQPYKI